MAVLQTHRVHKLNGHFLITLFVLFTDTLCWCVQFIHCISHPMSKLPLYRQSFARGGAFLWLPLQKMGYHPLKKMSDHDDAISYHRPFSNLDLGSSSGSVCWCSWNTRCFSCRLKVKLHTQCTESKQELEPRPRFKEYDCNLLCPYHLDL